MRIRPEELPTRRPTGRKIDIECLVNLFVAAGCLSSNTLPELADNGKDSFSTIRLGDGCGNPLFQTFSFGESIRIGNSSRASGEVGDYAEMKDRTLLKRRKRRRKSGAKVGCWLAAME